MIKRKNNEPAAELNAGGAADAMEHPGLFWCVKCMCRHSSRYMWLIIAVLAGVLVEACFIGSMPMSFKYLVDNALVGRNEEALWTAGFALAFGAVLASLAGLTRNFLFARVVSGVVSDLRERMFAKLQALSMEYYGRTRPGETITRFSADVATLENALTTAMPWAIMPGIDVCVSTVLLFWLDWRLALVAMLIWPMSLLGPRLLVPRALSASSQKLDLESQTLQWVQENVSGQLVVKALGLEPNMMGTFRDRNSRLRAMLRRLTFLSGLTERTSVIGIWTLQVVVLISGSYMAYRGWLSIGALGAFQALFLTLANSLSYVSQYTPTLIQAGGALKHIDELLRELPKVTDKPGATDLPEFKQAIVFENVSFGYSDSHLNLNKINLTIPRGTSVAFVGGSGSGKSTLASLAMRLYDPCAGRTLIDGRDLKEVTQQSWRRQIGVVLQENFLFDTSIRENIRLGNPSATDEEIIAAAKAAEIHDVIQRMPQGYDTPVGERGSRLSGGQRQRVAIARALVANPSILILDEATSALDPATEAQINRTLAQIARGRTVISVTHRLASVTQFDCVCVFNKGRLVEQGSHDELLSRRGYYHELWQKQNGFTLDGESDKVVADLERIRQLPILENLAPALQEDVASLFVTEHFSESCDVICEGEKGDRFYVIVRGSVEVIKNASIGRKSRLAVLEDGDYFGEMALLSDTPRNATIRTLTPCVLVSLRHEHFLEFLKMAPELRMSMVQGAGERAASLEINSPAAGLLKVNSFAADCKPKESRTGRRPRHDRELELGSPVRGRMVAGFAEQFGGAGAPA